MATVTPSNPVPEAVVPPATKLPPLENGDHLDQPTFHARYEAMPEGTRAELIDGVVFMMSPLKLPHGNYHSFLNYWLLHYASHTPSWEVADNTTVLLGSTDEVQPDLILCRTTSAERRGWIEDGYFQGPPELVVEIANTSAASDLHQKRLRYEQAGVPEYIVAVVKSREIYWFVRENGQFVTVPPDADGMYRARTFPGLWLDPAALWAKDAKKLLVTVEAGLATPEHREFVKKLGD